MGEPWKDSGDEDAGKVEYGMVWRFFDQSPAFAHGVEVGVIYERMQRREALIESTIHAENDEDVRNLANTFGYSVGLAALDEQGVWQHATLRREP